MPISLAFKESFLTRAGECRLYMWVKSILPVHIILKIIVPISIQFNSNFDIYEENKPQLPQAANLPYKQYGLYKTRNQWYRSLRKSRRYCPRSRDSSRSSAIAVTTNVKATHWSRISLEPFTRVLRVLSKPRLWMVQFSSKSRLIFLVQMVLWVLMRVIASLVATTS